MSKPKIAMLNPDCPDTVEQLLEAYTRHYVDGPHVRAEAMAAALREMADPSLRPPIEPEGLAARVISETGRVAARFTANNRFWFILGEPRGGMTWNELLRELGEVTIHDW
jgi:hypothetical protein